MNINEKKKILDDLIIESADEYLIFDIDKSLYLSDNGLYMSEKIQSDMIAKISRRTYNKITPGIFENLKLVYNIDTDEKLLGVITSKASIYVINKSLETNTLS